MSKFQCFVADDPHHPRFTGLPYGPRITVKFHANYSASYAKRESNLRDRLNELCMWSGHDKSNLSEDGKVSIYSYEFPNLSNPFAAYDHGWRYKQALDMLAQAGFGEVKKIGKKRAFYEGFR